MPIPGSPGSAVELTNIRPAARALHLPTRAAATLEAVAGQRPWQHNLLLLSNALDFQTAAVLLGVSKAIYRSWKILQAEATRIGAYHQTRRTMKFYAGLRQAYPVSHRAIPATNIEFRDSWIDTKTVVLSLKCNSVWV